MKYTQYQIITVNFDTIFKSTISKKRRCVIISPDEMNSTLQSLVVAPVISNSRNYPSRIKVTFGGQEGRVALDQIRTIHNNRVIKVSGKLNTKEIIELKNVLHQIYVD